MKKPMKKPIFFFLGCALLWACSEEESIILERENPYLAYQSDFSNHSDGWEGDFADLPVNDSIIYELGFAHLPLPAPLDASQNALMLRGANRSDDLFMYITKKFEGFVPNKAYNLSLSVKMASDAPWGFVGIGGAPAESVYLKAGLVNKKPAREIAFDQGFSEGYYVMNIDKGNQSQSGNDMKVLGDIGFEGEPVYTLIERNNNTVNIAAKSNAKGELWVIIGTDSGFEGTTKLYYSDIQLFFVNTP